MRYSTPSRWLPPRPPAAVVDRRGCRRSGANAVTSADPRRRRPFFRNRQRVPVHVPFIIFLLSSPSQFAVPAVAFGCGPAPSSRRRYFLVDCRIFPCRRASLRPVAFGSLHVFGPGQDAIADNRKAHIAPDGTADHGPTNKQSADAMAKDREAQHIAPDGPADHGPADERSERRVRGRITNDREAQ